MSAEKTSSVINSWETVRYELLNTRICDLGLQIEQSVLEPFTARLEREFIRARIPCRPQCYLTDSWGCPDEVPLIGIPFYLADKRLTRIEQEQTGEIEDDPTLMMFLRHEAGHAVNYAYRLWEFPGWTETFGSFTRPYRDSFQPNPLSRKFVRHLVHSQHGKNYAQKHPDEDFAETFAVWITPRSAWRRRYRYWPAVNKLKFISQLMRDIRDRNPVCTGGKQLNPVEELSIRLIDHYGQRTERYRAAAQGYVDDKLRDIFPEIRGRTLAAAPKLITRNLDQLLVRATRWSSLDTEDAEMILTKLLDRAAFLSLKYRTADEDAKLMDLTALTTALAMDFAYTGRFTD